jgi:hypothetical protein
VTKTDTTASQCASPECLTKEAKEALEALDQDPYRGNDRVAMLTEKVRKLQAVVLYEAGNVQKCCAEVVRLHKDVQKLRQQPTRSWSLTAQATLGALLLGVGIVAATGATALTALIPVGIAVIVATVVRGVEV